ncbi:peptidase inhibitor family I36 protein [Saccharothrix obliqua]|uniref:peptidase inhibitor family I36 protein n=1 Tax=Saccharothrix obliqua TaxID=2861747 RepID=UPI001C5FBD39|nr:peptidase inhibitor family I36 protein [Saccharothrix obliqua]MBW4717875.1 peptidase inhibitor family I36 protein [Saccharothrix obliqua]
MHIMRAVVMAVTTCASIVVAVPSAAASDPNCDQGDFCIWEHDDKKGRSWTWSGDDNNYGDDVNNGMDANDAASSWHNRGNAGSYPDVRVYRHVDKDEGNRCVHRGVYMSNLTKVGWDNAASRHRWTSC